MTKSSKDIVNATNAPETIPGIICGTITLIKACHGVAPKSSAASAKFMFSDANMMNAIFYTIVIALLATAISTVVGTIAD